MSDLRHNFVVYLDANGKPTTPQNATLKKIVTGTNRQSFYLAIIQGVLPSRRVRYERVNKPKC